MRDLLLSLHVLVSVFAIGPLAHAATVAARGVRTGDATAVNGSIRVISLYGYLSVVAGILGMSLVRDKWRAQFGDTWVWLSVVLFVLALVLTFALLVPSLRKAAAAITSGASTAALRGRIAASGGLIALTFAVIVFLMIYKPGHPGYS